MARSTDQTDGQTDMARSTRLRTDRRTWLDRLG